MFITSAVIVQRVRGRAFDVWRVGCSAETGSSWWLADARPEVVPRVRANHGGHVEGEGPRRG